MMKRRSTDDEKKKKKMNYYNGPDRISDLPDALLLYILSFLDIRHVISTSLLSRRWRFLWSGLGILNISDEVYNDCRSPNGYVDLNALKIDFTDYVHRMLLMRDPSSDISLFRFSYTDTESEYIDWDKEDKKFLGDIYLCILVLIRSNVQVLDLRISSMPARINLPHCLFSCKSLTTLKLDMEPTDIDVGPVQPLCNLPTEFGMNLPALRVLVLRSLSIVGDVGKLISSCPVLQVFVISKCKVKLCGRQLNISGSQLKMLEIEEVEDFRSETDSLEYCKVKVFAPKLTTFISRSTTTMNDYSFVDTSSLVNAEIETDEYSWGYYFYDDGKESDQRITWKQEFVIHLIKCFSGIRNVRSLTLAAWLLTTIPKAQVDFRSLRADLFCNLGILKLQTSLWKDEILGITCLLKKCPTLETLVLEMIEYEGGYTVKEDDVWKAELEPQCLMDHLKLIEIWDILTCVNELEFMKFLLKNATILEKMIVHSPKKQPPSDNIKLKSFGEKLKTFPAASSMTRILFLINPVIPFVCPHCMMWSTELPSSVKKGLKLWKDFTSNEDGVRRKTKGTRCRSPVGRPVGGFQRARDNLKELVRS